MRTKKPPRRAVFSRPVQFGQSFLFSSIEELDALALILEAEYHPTVFFTLIFSGGNANNCRGLN